MSNTKDNVKWHLASEDIEVLLTDFEYVLWRLFYTWIRWQEDCQRCISDDDLTFSENTLLHVIKMKDRPKSIYEIARLINRDDIPNIQYSIKKLIKLGYLKKMDLEIYNSKKTMVYTTTKKGDINATEYAKVRRVICVKLLEEMAKDFNIGDSLQQAKKLLTTMKSLYDEASRGASCYESKPEEKQSGQSKEEKQISDRLLGNRGD